MVFLAERQPIARKEYVCDACQFLFDTGLINDGLFSIREYRMIVQAKRNGYKIKKGQQYIKQITADGGKIFTYRAIPEIHDLVVKHGLYEE